MMNTHRRTRGLTITETLSATMAMGLIVALAIPLIGGSRDNAGVLASVSNLQTLSQAYSLYEADWDGRQYTAVADDMGEFSSVGSWQTVNDAHPPILLGWNCSDEDSDSVIYGYWMILSGNHSLVWPIRPSIRVGWFRLLNGKALHDYVNGRFYDQVFYAPNDTAVQKAVAPLLETDCEYVTVSAVSGLGSVPFWSSYCLSPAALFGPGVMDRENPQLNTDMAAIPDAGFACPTPAQAKYPGLKTRTIEHNWVQNVRGPSCNPAFEEGTYDGCEPFFFNHSLESSPVSLFYDGSIRLLPNAEAVAADVAVAKSLRSNDGLWFSPGSLPAAGVLNSDGYFNGAALGGPLDINHTILTIDGIRGRDTIEGAK